MSRNNATYPSAFINNLGFALLFSMRLPEEGTYFIPVKRCAISDSVKADV